MHCKRTGPSPGERIKLRQGKGETLGTHVTKECSLLCSYSQKIVQVLRHWHTDLPTSVTFIHGIHFIYAVVIDLMVMTWSEIYWDILMDLDSYRWSCSESMWCWLTWPTSRWDNWWCRYYGLPLVCLCWWSLPCFIIFSDHLYILSYLIIYDDGSHTWCSPLSACPSFVYRIIYSWFLASEI